MDQYVIKNGERVKKEPTMEEKLEKLLHIYELEVQGLIGRMPDYDRWGSGPYYRHRLSCFEQFVRQLKSILGKKEDL